MDLLRYLPEYQVLVCRSCQYALQPNYQVSHFVGAPHRIAWNEASQILEPYQDYPMVEAKFGSLIMPVPDGLVLEDLEVFKNGLVCQHCDYVCTSEKGMENHCRKEHAWKKSWKRTIRERPWWKTWCQRFFRSQGCRYFAVRAPAEEISMASQLDILRSQAEERLDTRQEAIKEKQRIISKGE